MNIKLNGKVRAINEDLTINSLIAQEESPKEGLVVMINDDIIAHELWNTREIKAEDEVELLCFVSGG